MTPSPRFRLASLALAAACVAFAATAPAALAQVVNPSPGQRPYRAYVPQDELVSFLPETPMSEFLALLNPVFVRETGKQLVDPEGLADPIGVSIAGMHFVDAFELVLDVQGLTFRETDDFFVLGRRVDEGDGAQAVGTDGASSQLEGGKPPPATAASREIRIDAHIFELNVNRLRETGSNWASLFADGGGGTATENQARLQFLLNTEPLFDRFGNVIQGPTLANFSDIVTLFRYFEQVGVGETIASPSVSVQSGEQGRIQSGTDIPVTLQDFAGNTITQYIATGVIIDVRPTLVMDASDSTDPLAAPVEFIHLDVKVEKSSGRPGAAGITIDKNQTSTQVLLLDGEQTVIGGLFSTEETYSRKGVPILMDIPIVKYLFSYKQKTTVQKELLIVLQSRVIDPLRARSERPFPTGLYERERDAVRERLDRFKEGAGDDIRLIDPDDPENPYYDPDDTR